MAAALVFVAGCEKSQEEEPDGAAELPATEQRRVEFQAHDLEPGVLFDWHAMLPVLEASADAEPIEFEDERDARRLSAGWHHAERSESLGPFAWVKQPATADFGLVEAKDRTLTLEIGGLTEEEREHSRGLEQALTLFWNREPLGIRVLDSTSQQLRLTIPAGAQRVGPNRLEIRPRGSFRIPVPSLPGASRPVAVKIRRIDLAEERGAPRKTEAAIEVDGGRVVQPAGSVVTGYVALQAGAKLIARGALDRAGGNGELTIVALAEDGEEVVLERRTLGEGGTFAIEHDLGLLGEQVVAISVAYRGDEAKRGGKEEPRIRWDTFRVVAPARELPAAEVAGEQGKRHHVLVILFDTLRADYTAPYGAPDDLTPAMAELAREGITFTNAFANAAMTRPSVASLFTSTYGSVHGISTDTQPLSERLDYLPEILRDAGYRTLAVLNNGNVAPELGFGRGFDEAHPYYARRKEVVERYRTPEAQADHVWERYVEPFAKRSEARPLFMYVHEIDPHGPYEPEPPYDRDVPRTTSMTRDPTELNKMIDRHQTQFDDASLRYLKASYRGEVAFMDRYLGRMLERLEGEGLAEETIVVFVSDHGEEFLEHGRFGHAVGVHDEVLRVPFIWRLPGGVGRGSKAADPVELIDFPPTLLDLLGLRVPKSMQGRSLAGLIRGDQERLEARPLYAHSVRILSDTRKSVRYRNWKLNVANGHSLYDTAVDPGETVDLWTELPAVGGAMRQMLAWRYLVDASRWVEPGTVDLNALDPAVVENLEALGYLH